MKIEWNWFPSCAGEAEDLCRSPLHMQVFHQSPPIKHTWFLNSEVFGFLQSKVFASPDTLLGGHFEISILHLADSFSYFPFTKHPSYC